MEKGRKISTETMKTALTTREPFISKPYRGTSGRLVMLLSAPVFDGLGNYIGLIGGTIYLESENVLKNMFNEHEHDDGSYVYVTDQTGLIIYHPDTTELMKLRQIIW